MKLDPKYSSNEKILFGIDDSMKILDIDIDFGVGKDSLFSIIENKLQRKICREGVDFGVNIGQNRIVKLHMSRVCTSDPTFCGLASFLYMHILDQDRYNVWFDTMNTNSAAKQVSNFIKRESYYNILVQWEAGTSNSSICNFIEQITDGYLLLYEDLAQMRFHQPLYTLNRNELASLKQAHAFEIEIGYGIHDTTLPKTRFLSPKHLQK